ncbi:MAG: MFS transporter [Rhodospirillaceae bacterium]|jgi:MFS family permease|nr:MFS transporter [Rhodospirillaceae bacterium]MBT3494308.1 MFS transporter [Rhodospirillaceae bacterium]MBT3780428.1 MFS transporter [Rhodospirillaceae bacterium]MBT3979151.1 MFS transporter [Rhodospirillaceae bacterium]MBT4170279.1 MFS transporter [Rhodospirillaceae bacterium]
MSVVQRLTGLHWREQGPIVLVGMGHGATHWLLGTFYILLPFIARQLELSYTETGLLVSAVHISSFGTNLFSGLVVDVTGRRVPILVASLSIGAMAMGGFGTANGVLSLLPLVVVIGCTNNLWHPAAISYLSRRFPETRGYALSIHALGANSGDALAPLAIGAALLWLSWTQAAMAACVPTLVVALILFVALPRSTSQSQQGASAGDAGSTGANEGMSLAAYWRGLTALVRDRAVLSLCLVAALRTMTQAGLLAFLPLYLSNDLGAGPLYLGAALAAMQASGVVAAPIAGAWSDRIGRRPIVLAGLSASTVVVASLVLIGSAEVFVVGLSVLGFVLFAVRPVIHSWMMDLTPPNLGGSATSLMFGSQAMLATAAPIIGGLIADTWGLVSVFYFLAGGLLAANLALVLLPLSTKAKTAAT